MYTVVGRRARRPNRKLAAIRSSFVLRRGYLKRIFIFTTPSRSSVAFVCEMCAGIPTIILYLDGTMYYTNVLYACIRMYKRRATRRREEKLR